MERRPITAELIARADRLLQYGVRPATVAQRLGLTQYVVRLMARDKGRDERRPPPPRPERQAPDPRRGTDATTIRMIQRMLAAHWLDFGQIAREAGVSQVVVEGVAAGKRPAISTEQFVLLPGERVLSVPARCPKCHALNAVVPCRACRARKGRKKRLRRRVRASGTAPQEAMRDSAICSAAQRQEIAQLLEFPEQIGSPTQESRIALRALYG